MINALTDEVIADAVRRLPSEHYALVGSDMERSLRARRDRLSWAADRMYETVFRHSDVRATDEDEVARVEGLADGSLRVAIYRRGTAAEPSGPAHFERTFFAGETREVRLYMHGGDDLVQIGGEGDSSILLRVITGGGGDELVNSTGREGVVLYDGGDATSVSGMNTKLVRR